jgi:2'-5' RNA ligase
MQSQNLYFLAIIPNGKVTGEVTAFKNHIAAHYNSHKALRVMPHITLKAPFNATAPQNGAVMGWFTYLNLKATPFTITLNGFGAFANAHNPVIYVKPENCLPLQQLQQEIINSFQNTFPGIAIQPTERVFSPHMTIAYRDLTFEQFERAWGEFKDKPYFATFEATTVALLQHDGTKWHVIAEKKLQ